MDYSIEEIQNFNGVPDLQFKIIVVGDSGVGKTNLLSRFTTNDYNQDSKATVGVELSSITFQIKNKTVTIHLWDTAGQERYKSLTAAYYKGAKGAMIVYDITKIETFKNIDGWFNEVREMGDKGTQILIVGNKSDLEQIRQVDQLIAKEEAETLGVAIMETSAKSSSNVHDAFKKLIIAIYSTAAASIEKEENEHKPKTEEIPKGKPLVVTRQPKDKKRSCC